MTIIINTAGIGPSNDGRSIIYLDVEYNNKHYDWKLYLPPGNAIVEYIEAKTLDIQNDIDYKEGKWANSDPNLVTYEEIVKPDDADYFVKRKAAYPPIEDQLDAIYKGVNSKEFRDMANTIVAIKAIYPKTRRR